MKDSKITDNVSSGSNEASLKSSGRHLSNEWSGRPAAALAMGRAAMRAGAKRGDLGLFKLGKTLANAANAELDRQAATRPKSSHPLAASSALKGSPTLSSPTGSASSLQDPSGDQTPSP